MASAWLWVSCSDEFFGQFEIHLRVEVGDDLVHLHVRDLALALAGHVLADDVLDFLHRLAGSEAVGHLVVEGGKHRFLEFLDGGLENDVLVAEVFDREILGKGDGDFAGFVDIHADELGGESGKEGLFIEADPEAFASGKIAGGLAEEFFGRLALDGRGVVDDREIAHGGGAAFDVVEIGEALLQCGELGLDFLVRHGARRHGDGDALVFRERDFGGEGQF